MNRLDLGISFFKDFSVGFMPTEKLSYIQKPILRDTFELTKVANLKGRFREFAIQGGCVDSSLEDYLTKLLRNQDYDRDYLEAYITPFISTSMSTKSKRILLELFKELSLLNPLKYEDQWEDLALVIRNQIASCTTEEETIKQIKKIKTFMLQAKTSEEAEIIVENFNKIPMLLMRKGIYTDKKEAENFVKYITDAGIIPTEGVAKAIESETTAAISMLKMLAKSNFRILDVDEYALTQILNNPSSNIRKNVLEELALIKNRDVYMKKDRFDSSQYVVAVGQKEFIFDKDSEVLLSSMTGPYTDREVSNFVTGATTHSNYEVLDGYGSLRDKDVIEKTGAVSYFRQASVDGQMDVFKVKDGNVSILSRAVSDPETGEFVVKQTLESPIGIKTKSRYVQQSKGDYVYNYSIKSLLDMTRTYKILDDNNFVSTFNGQKYSISVVGDLLNITTRGITETIDLKKLVPSGDEKILDMIKHLPGDELINIKKSGLKEIEPYLDNAEGSGRIDNLIRLGAKHLGNPFIFLHEFGHYKASKLDNAVWDKILKIYHKELSACKAQTTSFDLNMIDHIIENDHHYMNHKHGAVEEVFCDVNALLKVPNIDRGLAERVLFIQEMFPETVAEISKYI